jgi:hypothetical protein
MLILTIVLAVLAAAGFFVVVPRLAATHGPNVASRYYEKNFSYSATCDGDIDARRAQAASATPKCMRDFATFAPQAAAAYVWPVLFPADLAVIALLTAALAVGAWTFAASAPAVAGSGRLVLMLPFAYFVADLAEDALLAWLLSRPDTISDGSVLVLKTLTGAKLATLILSLIEVVALLALALPQYWRDLFAG